MKFRMNRFQQQLFDNLWYLNIVLKARQLGITTFIDILFLDSVLFSKDKHAAIIAHTKEDAEVIFNTKVKYPFDNLPDWLKSSFKVNQDTLREFKFNNGSSIRVATSVRSGTLQYLHISEFGYTCAKYPEKATEIIAGSLNTVHPGQLVFIESTAKGREGSFYEMCNRSMGLGKSNSVLTELDYRFFFFPWHENAEYRLETPVYVSQDFQDYFAHVEKECATRLEPQQKWWYIKKSENQKDEMKSEFPSYPEEAFKASMEGSYYGKFVDQAFADKRVGRVPYDSRLMVDTWWDLGIGDQTAILFTQTFNNEIRIIDAYASSGEGLAHYAKILQEKKYVYGTHTAPHDIAVKELGTGKSRKEIAAGLGLYFRVAKKLPIDDGIEAGRSLFSRLYIDEHKCEKFLIAIAHYKKEWDDDNATFRNKPLHDFSSHAADAYRTLAVSYIGSTVYVPIKEEQEREDARAQQEEPFDRFNVVSQI